jgi:alpha-L-rhamnosidase
MKSIRMKYLIRLVFSVILLFGITIILLAQLDGKINPNLINKQWLAKWITCPGISGKEIGVYLFRKIFNVNSETAHYIIHISADNRYKLYVNENYVGNGPARGDLMKWYFETYDISPYLKKGVNVISAVVWNFAEYRSIAQFSSQTGLIVQGDGSSENSINTNDAWLVIKDSAYQFLPVNIGQYYVVGPGEKFNSKFHPWNWMQPEFDHSTWQQAKELDFGRPLNSFREWGSPSDHILFPRVIPPMEEMMQRFRKIRRSDIPDVPDHFIKGTKPLIIPAHSNIKILLDQEYLTNAYPVITFSGGKNSKIKFTYAESLFNEYLEKGNRNEIINKRIIGNQDVIIADGAEQRIFQTLWWRTFRYIEIEITSKEEPLTIHDFYSISTAYPFIEKATFRCSDSLFTNIWNVGWRTQRLCAGETYFDCPYYEQLQYAGDTRIQSLVSSYVSGDSRLMRNAIASIHDSRIQYGITQSRYPSYQPQIIPTFSLVWITMVCDYWMINGDKQFVKSMIPGIMDVLNWYESKIDSTGMLGHLEWWNFVDWVQYWEHGVPPGIYNSHSSIVSLQYVYTLQKAATLLSAFNMKEEALRYSKQSENIKTAVFKNCFDQHKGLLADVPEKNIFSQHANALAILTDALPETLQRNIIDKILQDTTIARCSFYFRFYLNEAAEKAGMADLFPELLGPWKKMLDNGLTTFAEEPDPSRSDCHAWSAWPVHSFLSMICGIKPGAPGFKTVQIEPHMGRLNWIEGSMPHPMGTIRVKLNKDSQGNLTGEVTLPENVTGSFTGNGKVMPLKGGTNIIK